MKWNLSTHLSAVAFIAFATPAHAAEIRCDTCINAAVSAVRAREAGIGLHYIFSVDTGAVFRFQVEREPNSEGAYDWFVGSGSLSWRNFLPMEGATLQGMGATILNILKSVPLGTQ